MELLEDLLEEARKLNASDLHITVNHCVSLRIDGKLRKTKLLITKEQVTKMLAYVLKEKQLLNLEACGELDCAFIDSKGLPYRVNIAKSDGQYLLVMRIIKLEIPSCEELLLPETVQAFANLKQGLVLVCGATGSGKSTTLAALIEKINCERKLHIVTLEDPIEYRYISKKSLIHQREVGRDTASFAIGLRSVLRQDPDVI